MNDLYAEAGVKRKETITTIGIRVLMIFVAIIALLFSTRNMIMLAVSAILVCAIFFVFPLVKTEFEYIFCDGQVDFDRIMGGQRRKTILRIDLENVEIVAPIGSHALDSYKNNHTIKTKNFTSLKQDIKPYVIIVRVGENLTQILFEPSEKMITCMQQKAPRKVVQY